MVAVEDGDATAVVVQQRLNAAKRQGSEAAIMAVFLLIIRHEVAIDFTPP